MSKGKNFNDFTYGVGLEINATSFKQVKDDLKVNLDSLSKMVKSYSKVLKIDPNADLSKLFEEMRKVKSIVDGINNSDNSFAGFVDKGVLGRIESLESSLKAVGDTSAEIKSNIESLKTSITSLVEPLKAAGQIKFPATFENLFGDIKDQSAQIKNVTNTIKQVESSLAKLQTMWESLGSLDANTDWNDTEILNWIKRIEEIQDELSSASDIDPKKLQKFITELNSIGSKLGSAMASMSKDKLTSFRIDEEYVVDSINDVINIIEKKKVQLEEELRSLNEIQIKFDAKNQISSSSRSLGVQSDYTAQVKVAPKTNEAEWISKINDTITNIEGQLKRVKLTPTFSKSSKNIEKEISEGAAQINHAIKVDFQIVDDLDNSFDARIKEIDNRIKSAKNQIEQNAKFKLSFTYDENEDFKKSAYEVINKFKEDFKKFETTFVIKDEKAFLERVAGLRQKIKAELKNIPVNFEEIPVSFLIKNYDKFLSSVDQLKTDTESKIGNIGVNLNIANLPQFMAQAVMMRDAVEKVYNNNPVGLGIGPSTENVGVEGAAKNIEELSDAAKAAKEDLEKCKSVLKSLSEQGFNAPEFLQLGDITSQGKKAKGSTKKLEELLNKYKTLKAKVPDDIGARWAELYPEANGDLAIAAQMARKVQAELKQVESELNIYLQKQIAYTQNRLEQSEKVLQTEKKIVSTKKDQAGAKQDDKTEVQSNKQLAMSAEEAAKKVKSLNGVLTQRKKVLKDLETKGIDSTSFIKLGEWDKESGSFKKNKQEIQALVNKYNELKEARKQSGGTKAVGEEASLRGKLSSILRQQKQHVAEIISQNQAELKSAQEISKAYKDAGKSKKESTKVQKDTKSTKEIDTLTSKLNKAKDALELLQTKKLEALSMTGLGDKKHRLDSIGSSQNFDELIKEYNLLIAKRNELEKSGMDITHPEYVAYAKQYQGVEQQLNVIYNDQLKYTQSRVKYYETQISKAQQLLQLEQKQTEEEKRQAQIDSTSKKTKSSVASGAASSNVVKLDGSTLNSLAKDATLKSIDGKINNIVSRLGKGMNITGSNISINASNVNLKGSNKNIGSSSGRKTAAGDKGVKATTLSSYARQLTTFEEQIKRSGLYTEEFENRLASLHRALDKVSVQKDFDAYKIGLDRFKEEFEQLKTYDKLYQDFVKSQSKQIQLTHDIAASNGPTAEMQEQLKIEERISDGLENQLTQYTTLYTQRTRQLAIEEAISKANQEIVKSTAAQSDSVAKQQNKELVKIVDSAQNKLKEMQYSMQNSKVPMVDVAIKKFGEYDQLLSTLKLKQQAIIADPDLLKNEGYAEGFNDLLRQMKKVEEEFTTLQKSSENFLKKITSIEDIKPLDKTFNPSDLEQMHDAMQDFANQASVGAAKLIEFNDAEQTATFAIKDGKGHVQQLTVAYDVATNSLGRYTSQTRESMSETQKFLNSLKHSFQNVARYVASFGSVYELFAIIKRGITYVKDIDSALTELKKVTDETDASYARFLQDMSKTGKVVGATVADLTTMASEWARLGYSMEEAGKLAQSTAVLLNVSEFEDATKASEALISTMQAFQYTAEESGHVVDILNEIGNNYAVSSDGIATALQDSASALMEGGNNLEQAVALVAAANRVVQDPNSVGSALRTISLRLRGTSVKILEEMGEETDGVVESVSKLQSKIKALSGVNILTDAGEYKDTYTILKEIGTVWEEMSDIDQAALLELMAGKNRANTLSAILSNMKDLEGAYKDALRAEGSALKENEAYLDSIQGRIDLFNNSVQTMWMNTISSEVVKDFVNLGTTLIGLVDKLGLIRTLITGIFTYITTFSKHKIDFASLLGIHDLDTGWFSKKIKAKKSDNVAKVILGDPSDINASVSDFVDAIQDNISNYITIDTSRIDGEIDNVQKKLATAHDQLDAARKADWNYYRSLGSIQPAKDRDNRIAEQRQQVKTLEADLVRLQAQRDHLISSAVDSTATSMVGSINEEKQALQSMLSVLEKVKDAKLYLGSEQDAAEKIDAMSSAAKKGQTDLVNYVSSLDDADVALKAYAATVKDGNYSLAGFQQFIAQHNSGLKASGMAAKAAAVGHQLLNAALSMGIALIVSGLISGMMELVNANEKIAESAREAATAAKELREQAEALADYKDRIHELRTELDNNTLSEQEAYDARQELLTIQDELIDKYGLERDGINLVTGAINEQIAAIDALSQKNAQTWLNTNQDSINKATEYFDSATQGSNLDGFWEGGKTTVTNWGSTSNVSDMIEAYAKTRDHIEASTVKGIGQDINFVGSVEEVKQEVDDFLVWLDGKEIELNNEKSDLLALPDQNEENKAKISSLEKDIEQLQHVREDLDKEYKNWFGADSAYAANKALLEEAQYNRAITTYADQYGNILQAQKDLADAQIKGDKDGMMAALDVINKETENASETAEKNGQNYMVSFFDGIKSEYEVLANELNFENILSQDANVQKNIQDILSGFDGKNAEEILQFEQADPNNSSFVALKQVADQYNLSVKDLINSLVELGYVQAGFGAGETEKIGAVVRSYSTLAESVESFKEAQTQTSEIISDNIEVTQEYKDALIALGVSEEDLNECFYDTNKLVVKDAKGLNNLVKSAKKNTAQNIKLAKSQARLEYYELYKEMRRLTNGTEVSNAATLRQINALYEQMSVVQRTISKYSLLEAELLGTANAYQELADAQAADEAMDYGTKAEELVNVLAEAFNTSELGTEAARVAIEGLIPDDVIDKSKTLDEQMQQIYDYFTGGEISKLFTIEFDEEGAIKSVEMTKENIQKFTESLIGTDSDSVFQGTWDEFTLNPAIQTLEDFAKACGVTEEIAFAFLTSLEKYDIANALGAGGDTLLDQLMGDNVEYQLQKIIETAAKAEKRLAEGLITADSQEYREAQRALEEQEEKVLTDTTSWARKQSLLAEQKDKLVDLEKQYKKAYEAGEDTSNIEQAIENTSSVIDTLIADLGKLDEPTTFVLEVAKSEAEENIAEFKEELAELVDSGDEKAIKINAFVEKIDTAGLDGLEALGFIKGEDGVWRGSANIEGWSSLDPASKQQVLNYINQIEGEHQIDVLLGQDAPTVEDHLQTIADTLERIANLLDPTYTVTVETSEAEENVSWLKSLLDGIKDKTVTVTQYVKSIFSGNDSGAGGAQSVNGTAHIGGTAYAGGNWGAPKTETALVGELGPEIIVDPQSGRWHTVGDTGAEFTQVKRGSIIFNHKQTEELLKNGHVTGRGKAYASGTAYRAGINTWDKSYKMVAIDYENAIIPAAKSGIDTHDPKDEEKDYKDLSDAASDAADEFREVFDWIEVRLEEINEDLNLKNAKLENAIGASAQNAIIDDMIALNRELYDNLLAGAEEYYKYSATLLEKVPEEYRNAAQDGTIAIEEFVGEVDEETLNAIQEYREWVQKGADTTQQAEETLTEISNLAAQAIQNIEDSYDNLISKNDAKMDQLDANNAYMDTTTGFESEDIYAAMIKENEEKIKTATEKRDAMQAELDKRVQAGEIAVDSQEWYDAVNAIAEVDTEIINLKTDNEDFQDSINELHWEKFDLLMKQFQAVADEAENLRDILGTKDAVDELGNWTDEGVTSLGLLAQQMEVAEMQAKQYQDEIDYLNENWEELGYTQEEYLDKLEELKSGQYDAIQSYHDAKDAIVELNKARIDAIKDGIEKEIDAYEKLIEAKKEELDAEKDLYDFQKGVAKQQKDIADIERQLAALSNDNSASARAKRAQLEAELYEAKAALEETYYDRSISNQQEALDKELENFQNEKDEEIEELEEYLENIELVVADSLYVVQESAAKILETLTVMGEQYGLTITDALLKPWEAGSYAIQEYGTKLNISLTELASIFGLTVDGFAEKLGMTTAELVASLDITVAQMAESLGLTNEDLAARLGLTVTDLSGMMNMTIQELATNMGITIPVLAEKLGTTTAGLVGNLNMTMAQFAGKMGLTVDELAGKFGLTAGELADKLGLTYQDLTNPFGLSMSATVDALKALETEYSNILANIIEESKKAVEEVNKAMETYQSAEKQEKKQETSQNKNTSSATNTKQTIAVGGKINAGNARIYSDSYGGGGGKQYYSQDPIYTVLQENNGYVLVRHHKLKNGYTGWFRKSDIKAYAKGTSGIDEDQLALLHELGDELVLAAGPNGKLQYITRGTAVIPHDISENLMELGQLDPSEILRRNTPQIGASPSVVNNAVEINMNIAEVVHIDSVSNETIPDLTKAVRKEMDSYMVKLNNAIKAKVR